MFCYYNRLQIVHARNFDIKRVAYLAGTARYDEKVVSYNSTSAKPRSINVRTMTFCVHTHISTAATVKCNFTPLQFLYIALHIHKRKLSICKLYISINSAGEL